MVDMRRGWTEDPAYQCAFCEDSCFVAFVPSTCIRIEPTAAQRQLPDTPYFVDPPFLRLREDLLGVLPATRTTPFSYLALRSM